MIRAALLAALAALVLAPLAAAHAELDPGEAPAGSFQRFVLHIPNESDTAATVKVAVRFPESVATATFVRVPGWTRTVTTLKLDQPTTDAEGNEIDERIVTVTWEGGTIEPGETGEFPFSFEAPDQPGATIFFPTVQTYSDGSVSRWIGAPGSDEPAPGVLIAQGTGGGDDDRGDRDGAGARRDRHGDGDDLHDARNDDTRDDDGRRYACRRRGRRRLEPAAHPRPASPPRGAWSARLLALSPKPERPAAASRLGPAASAARRAADAALQPAAVASGPGGPVRRVA